MDMKKFFSLVVLIMMGLSLLSCSDSKRDVIGKTEIVIETSRGNITARLYDDTPIHRDNFIKMIE